jgi:bifunctional DNA-binding transcriptional regulator/antitoxin component of YhaV-PrlF toxin-antitoxin module
MKHRITEKNMGHKIKIQRVERGTTKSYYVNFPAALAEAARIEKGEEMEWLVDDRNTFLLRRVKPIKPVSKGKITLT